MTAKTFSHTRYDISLFGIELTESEELEMVKVIEDFARAKHPEQKIAGSALWAPGAKQARIKDFNPITLEQLS